MQRDSFLTTDIRYNVGMSAWALNVAMKALVIGNALLLAMPPGWCCRDWTVRDAAPAPAASCCHARTAGHASSPGHTQHAQAQEAPSRDVAPAQPALPKIQCCCLREAPTPPRVTFDAQTQIYLVLSPAPSLDLTAEGAAVARVGDAVFHNAGPPLHVLQCVWLC